MSNNLESSLANLVTEHREASQFSDARLAQRCCELADEPAFISGSTIRSWSTDNPDDAPTWQQLTALASVLGLNSDEVDELLAAGDFELIEQLRKSVASEEERFLSAWPIESSDVEISLDALSAPTESPVGQQQAELENAWFDATDATASTEPKGPATRLRFAVLAGCTLLAVGAFAGLRLLADSAPEKEATTQQPAGPASDAKSVTDREATAGDAVPGLATETIESIIVSPTAGQTFAADVSQRATATISGSTTAGAAIDEIRWALSDPDQQKYWNSTDASWQPAYIDFEIPVEAGQAEVEWQEEIAGLNPGVYLLTIKARNAANTEAQDTTVSFSVN